MLLRFRTLAAVLAVGIVVTACHGGPVGIMPAEAGAAPAVASQLDGMTEQEMHPDGLAAAYGKLVSLGTNEPLKGVPVAVYPWQACHKVSDYRVSCPAALYKAQTAANGDFSIHLKTGGHYLLVIGNDSGKDQVRTTIHDSITLHSGFQTLVAPKPCADPWDFGKGVPRCILKTPLDHILPSETSGHYRLADINGAKELPCIAGINKLRVQHGYLPLVVDEWLLENERQFAAYYTNPLHDKYPGKGTPFLAYPNLWGWGGTQCPYVDTWNAQKLRPYVFNPQTQWFGARFDPYVPGSKTSAFDIMIFREDPRYFHDPAVPYWP